ncbi:hypothetical protein [Halostagnicola bangensis]
MASVGLTSSVSANDADNNNQRKVGKNNPNVGPVTGLDQSESIDKVDIDPDEISSEEELEEKVKSELERENVDEITIHSQEEKVWEGDIWRVVGGRILFGDGEFEITVTTFGNDFHSVTLDAEEGAEVTMTQFDAGFIDYTITWTVTSEGISREAEICIWTLGWDCYTGSDLIIEAADYIV